MILIKLILAYREKIKIFRYPNLDFQPQIGLMVKKMTQNDHVSIEFQLEVCNFSYPGCLGSSFLSLYVLVQWKLIRPRLRIAYLIRFHAAKFVTCDNNYFLSSGFTLIMNSS